MHNSGLPKLVYVLLAACGLIYFSFVYPQLPDLMASHFNAGGVATSFMPKAGFFGLFLFVMIFASIPAFLVPWQIAALPNNKINLPNKEYWLAPERRAETIQYIGMRMGWFGCALLAFLLYGFHFAVSANLRPDHTFDSTSFLFGLGVFFAFIFVWLTRMLGHFRRPA